MLKYRKYKINSENEQMNGKVAARAVIDQTIGIDQLAAHMAKRFGGTGVRRYGGARLPSPVALHFLNYCHFVLAGRSRPPSAFSYLRTSDVRTPEHSFPL